MREWCCDEEEVEEEEEDEKDEEEEVCIFDFKVESEDIFTQLHCPATCDIVHSDGVFATLGGTLPVSR